MKLFNRKLKHFLIVAGLATFVIAGSSVFKKSNLVNTLAAGPAYIETITPLFGSSSAWSAAPTSDNKTIIAGGGQFMGGSEDAVIAKLDTDGSILWANAIGGGGSTKNLNSIQQTSDGGYIASGYSYPVGPGFPDMLLIKFNSVGAVSWTKVLSRTRDDYLYSIQETSDGGYIGAGYTITNPNAFPVVIKFDSSGNIVWHKAVSSVAHQGYLYSIDQTSDGGYIAGGQVFAGAGLPNIMLIKLDAFGNISWTKAIGGAGSEVAREIQETSDGGFILAGDDGLGASLVLKMDSSGSFLWGKTIPTESNGFFWSIKETGGNGYITAGSTSDFITQGSLIVKLDSTGNVEWAKKLDNTTARSIYENSDNEYVLTGDSMMVAHVDTSGNIASCTQVGSLTPTASDFTPTVTALTPTYNSPAFTVTSPVFTENDPTGSAVITQICTAPIGSESTGGGSLRPEPVVCSDPHEVASFHLETLSQNNRDDVRLTWSNPAVSLSAIEILRDQVVIATLPASTTEFTDSTLSPGSSATYAVRTLSNCMIPSPNPPALSVSLPLVMANGSSFDLDLNITLKIKEIRDEMILEKAKQLLERNQIDTTGLKTYEDLIHNPEYKIPVISDGISSQIQGHADSFTLQIWNVSDRSRPVYEQTLQTNLLGESSLTIPDFVAGNYDFTIFTDKSLRKALFSVSANRNPMNLDFTQGKGSDQDAYLKIGDLNHDGKINLDDIFSGVSAIRGKNPELSKNDFDLTEDGEIGLKDFLFIIKNWGTNE